MQIATYPGAQQWTWWQKNLFRFFVILFTLYIEPWTYINFFPGAYKITEPYYQFQLWCVEGANRNLFHVKEVLTPLNGSGDTSYGFAQLYLYVTVAIVGAIVWAILGRKSKNHNAVSYWFILFARYFLIYNCLIYGFDKLFLLQMSFPNTSQLATPLGDFLPMRLSWMFMGYSSTYQCFSGILEIIAALLLLFRRTSTLGLFFAGGIFLNVMMLNLSYDIPVKLFSIQLFLLCLFMLSFEAKRIFSFFVLNKSAEATAIYSVRFEKRWMRILRILLKLSIVIFGILMPFYNTWQVYADQQNIVSNPILPRGVYEVNAFSKNNDGIPYNPTDSLRWGDLIVDTQNMGSIATKDTLFRQRYGRGYFNFTVDEKNKSIAFNKNSMTGDSVFLFKMNYTIPDSNTIQLSGMIQKDTIFVSLKKTKRHFQLEERQFHWMSEYNR